MFVRNRASRTCNSFSGLCDWRRAKRMFSVS